MRMKPVRYLCLGLGSFSLLVCSQLYADGQVDNGKNKFEACLGCHGIDGYANAYPTFRVPKLGGQNAAYISAALKGYRDGQRKHGTMTAQAADMSDQDIADIAAYLATLKP